MLRITDSRMYGNKYGLLNVLRDLTNACFAKDIAENVNTIRQNLQIGYVKTLCKIADLSKPGYDNISVSAAIGQLKQIKQMLSTPAAGAEAKAHREHILLLIDNALDVKK
ncbi:MAG: hypothetical protein LC096_09540, partial [Bacteroidia bacterium]|nr:hypothetical protein [Bacteroidia bacterium]